MEDQAQVEGARIEEEVEANPIYYPRFLQDSAALLRRGVKGQFGNRVEFRPGVDKWADPRAALFSAELLAGKKVLDVGCGDGVLDITLAMRYKPRSLLGLDLDPRLIKRANKNLRYCLNMNAVALAPRVQSPQAIEFEDDLLARRNERLFQLHKSAADLPACFRRYISRFALGQYFGPMRQSRTPQLQNCIAFESTNYLADEPRANQYDIILCLKLTKWVQLNFGDAGLKRLFFKLSVELVPGGTLVLQSQPWASVRKEKNQCGLFRQNFKRLLIRPSQFSNELEALGLKLVHQKQGLQFYQKAS